MYYTYVLESIEHGKLYIGQTNDVEKRLHRHNTGQEKYTKKYLPWKLIYVKEFAARSEAMQLEKKLKSFKNRKYLLNWIAAAG